MKPIHLYIMDIATAGITSGVDRHIETLLDGLRACPDMHVYRIQLLHDRNLIMHRVEKNEYYTKVTLPLPQNYKEIVAEKFWMQKYNEHVFRIIKDIFPREGHCILHLHTLNLIDLALLVKQHVHCKIITHLHCIPWKEYYNSDEDTFNFLYRLALPNSGKAINPALFVTNNSELDSYALADHIISVTRCGTDFLVNRMKISRSKITIVHNGINDYAGTYRKQNAEEAPPRIQCLFVANMSKSKGLNFVFKALRIVKRKGYEVELNVAGYLSPAMSAAIKVEQNDLNVTILGALPFDRLIEFYKSSDIGLIASLQEQWSLAAVEMSMFGLPVVTTAVDGLDELFTDNVDALKVGTLFSNTAGLSVNAEQMAEKIIRLIEHKELRMQLSKNVRCMYEKELSLQRMMQQIVSVYQRTIGEP